MSDADQPSPAADARSYGRAFADVYDHWYADLGPASDPRAVVDRVGELAPDGLVLELGVGTGRLAHPLAGAGHVVIGLDASRPMLNRLHAKPIDAALAVQSVEADMADMPFGSARFTMVVIAYNTLFNLTPEAQGRCLAECSRVLVPGGRLAIEAFIASSSPAGTEYVTSAQRADADEVVMITTRRQSSDGRILGAHLQLRNAGVRVRPWELYYRAPALLDADTAAAGLRLEHRWADWHRTAYDPLGGQHVSVYRQPSLPI